MSGTFTESPACGYRGVLSLTYGKERYTVSVRERCGVYLAAPIRMIVVPQTGHFPFIAGLPFFSVMAAASFISRFALHFTQYAWTMRFASRPESRGVHKGMVENGKRRKPTLGRGIHGFLH